MKKLDLENKVITIGNTSLNTVNLQGLTREEFMKTFPKIFGSARVDIKDAWKIIKPYTFVKKPKPTNKK